MSALAPHQQRVVEERADLVSRLLKLREFISSDRFAFVDKSEQARMFAQAGAMAAYAFILGSRIDAF